MTIWRNLALTVTAACLVAITGLLAVLVTAGDRDRARALNFATDACAHLYKDVGFPNEADRQALVKVTMATQLDPMWLPVAQWETWALTIAGYGSESPGTYPQEWANQMNALEPEVAALCRMTNPAWPQTDWPQPSANP